MPPTKLPETVDEYNVWKAVVSSQPKTPSDEAKLLNAKDRSLLRMKYYVVNGTLKSRQSQKDVFVVEWLTRVMREFHDQANHPGRNTVIQKLKNKYDVLPDKLIRKYIAECDVCNAKRTLAKAPVGKPIKSYGIWSRVGMDLIDMSSVADGDHRWIFHAKDHLSKFTYARALKTKKCQEVTAVLREMLHTLGEVRILQHDQGGEFVGKELKDMMKNEFPNTILVASRPRHPQTNGLIERANGVLEQRICAWKLQTGRDDWSVGLLDIVRKRNQEWSRTIGTSPFKMFFGRNPLNELHDLNSDDGGGFSSDDDEDDEQAVRNDEELSNRNSDEDGDQAVRNDEELSNPDNSNKGSDDEISSDSDDETDDRLYLLFLNQVDAEPEAVAITTDARQAVKGGESIKKGEKYFRVVQAINEQCIGHEGEYVRWKTSKATCKLGSTVEEIITRLPGFLTYLKDRAHEGKEYAKKVAQNRNLAVGDHVLLPIPRSDRSGTCRKNLQAQVVDVDGARVKLGTANGRIASTFLQEQLQRVSGQKRPIEVPDTEISIIKACRSETAYGSTAGSSVCHCKVSCKSNRCMCYKQDLKCGSKCHSGKPCGNPK